MSDAITEFNERLAAEEAARWAPQPEAPAEAPPEAPPEALAATPSDPPSDPPADATDAPEAPEATTVPAPRSDEDEMGERIKRAHIESREAKRRARQLEEGTGCPEGHQDRTA